MTLQSQLAPTEPLPVDDEKSAPVRAVPHQPERQMAPDYYLG